MLETMPNDVISAQKYFRTLFFYSYRVVLSLEQVLNKKSSNDKVWPPGKVTLKYFLKKFWAGISSFVIVSDR